MQSDIDFRLSNQTKLNLFLMMMKVYKCLILIQHNGLASIDFVFFFIYCVICICSLSVARLPPNMYNTFNGVHTDLIVAKCYFRHSFRSIHNSVRCYCCFSCEKVWAPSDGCKQLVASYVCCYSHTICLLLHLLRAIKV